MSHETAGRTFERVKYAVAAFLEQDALARKLAVKVSSLYTAEGVARAREKTGGKRLNMKRYAEQAEAMARNVADYICDEFQKRGAKRTADHAAIAPFPIAEAQRVRLASLLLHSQQLT